MQTTQSTVLVVDDNPSLLKMVRRHLEKRVQVATAESAARALDLIRERTPLVVFVDIHLGAGDDSGIALVQQIRELDAALPVCMLTCDQSADVLMECLSAGANDFIWKGSLNPSAVDAMRMTVDRLEDPDADKGDPIFDNSILRSRGLLEHHLRLLSEYAAADFPALERLAEMQGESLEVLTSRFYRIRLLLGLRDHETLVKLLRVAKGYTGRMSCPPPPA